MSEIKGINSLMSKLNSLGGNADVVLLKSVEYCGKFVEDDAKLNCPVDMGDLVQSIQHETKAAGGSIRSTIYTNSDHAAYVEFGTGQCGEGTYDNSNVSLAYNQDWVGMPAQPYLYPALKDNETQLKAYIANQLRKEIKRVVGR